MNFRQCPIQNKDSHQGQREALCNEKGVSFSKKDTVIFDLFLAIHRVTTFPEVKTAERERVKFSVETN